MSTSASPTFSYTLYSRDGREAIWNGANVGVGARYGVTLAVDNAALVVAAAGTAANGGSGIVIYPNSDGGGFDSSKSYTLNPNLPAGIGFGNSLSLSDSYLSVGCSGYRDYSGAVLFYERRAAGDMFSLRQILMSPNATAASGSLLDMAGSEFADAIAVDSSSDTLVVSAPNFASGSGMVTVYARGSAGVQQWSPAQILHAPSAGSIYFGSPLALADKVLCVSAIRQPWGSARNFGAVFVYFRAGYSSPFAITQTLSALDAPKSSSYSVPTGFGNSLALSTRYLFVGTGERGVVYMYANNRDGTMRFTQRLVSPLPATNSFFGYTLALQGEVLAVGHTTKNVLTNKQSSGVYIYARSPSSSSSSSFSMQQYIYPSPSMTTSQGQLYEYFGSYLGVAPDGTLAVANVGVHDEQGDMLLFSPACMPGSYFEISSLSPSGLCTLCPAGTYDSSLGQGADPSVCVQCPATRSGGPAGSISCSYRSPPPTLSPTPPPPTPKPSLPPSPLPTFQPSASAPTPKPSASAPTPKPSAKPTWWPTRQPTPTPSARPSAFPTPFPTLRPHAPLPPRGTNSSLAGASSGSNSASSSSSSAESAAVATVVCVVAAVFFLWLYRRWRKRGEDEEEAKGGEVVVVPSSAPGRERRLTAYEKCKSAGLDLRYRGVIYEDSVRAKRISSMFAGAKDEPEGTGEPTPLASIPGMGGASVPRGPSLVRLSLGGGGGDRDSMRRSSVSREPSGQGQGLVLTPTRSSFKELGALYEDPRRSSSGRRSSFGFGLNLGLGLGLAGFGGSAKADEPSSSSSSSTDPEGGGNLDPAASDPELRESLSELSNQHLPAITVGDALALIKETRATSDEETATAAAANTLNPLLGGTLRPVTTISTLRAQAHAAPVEQGGAKKRLSVTAATRVSNPLFDSQVRRASLNNRLGRTESELPPTPEVEPAPAPETGATELEGR